MPEPKGGEIPPLRVRRGPASDQEGDVEANEIGVETREATGAAAAWPSAATGGSDGGAGAAARSSGRWIDVSQRPGVSVPQQGTEPIESGAGLAPIDPQHGPAHQTAPAISPAIRAATKEARFQLIRFQCR